MTYKKVFGMKLSPLAMTALAGILVTIIVMVSRKLLGLEGFDPMADAKLDVECKPNPIIQRITFGFFGHGNCPNACETAGGSFKKPWLSESFCYKKKEAEAEVVKDSVVKASVIESPKEAIKIEAFASYP